MSESILDRINALQDEASLEDQKADELLAQARTHVERCREINAEIRRLLGVHYGMGKVAAND